jgi:glycosyltransferase involved in cell wall biosynthesis
MSAFNVEKYLRGCLDCVVNQTLRDVEIICVNDGSTDGTLAILEEYAARDPRLKIIDKPVNEGLAVARNEALAQASGKYVGFVDGDDLLDRDLFRKAYERAEEMQSDLLFWDYVSFWTEKELERKVMEPSSLLTISPSDKTALLKRPSFAWTKLIRMDKVKALDISFPKGLTRQDIPVHWKLVTQLDKISILPERLSYYRQQPSATTHQTGRKVADIVIVMDLVKGYLTENKLYATYKDAFLWHQLEILSGMADRVGPAMKPIVMKMIQERLGDDHWQYIMERKPLRWQTRDFYLAMRGILFSQIRRAIWLSARRYYRKVNSSIPIGSI